MRAVLDTNILVSGLLWHGPPHVLFEHVRNGTFTLISSPPLLAEFSDVIRRPKLRAILSAAGITQDHLLEELRRLAELFDPLPLPTPICRDPDDDAVLALAVAARADCIVSGDADLLAIGSYADIPIIDAAKAIAGHDARRP
jgi:putative PIN family toxin of toxin-antitoxin system